MGTLDRGWPSLGQRAFRHDALGREEASLRRTEKESVEEGVGSEHLPVAGGIRAVGMDDRRVEPQRGHGHELHVGVGRVGQEGAPGPVGRAHQAQIGVDPQHVGAETGPGRQERDAPRRRLEAQEEHALVDLGHLDPPVLTRSAPVRIERDGVESDEAAHHLAYLARRAQQAYVRPSVGDDGQIGQIGPADGAHHRHRLAPRTPPADADGHARAELAHDVVHRRPLVGHRPQILTGTCRRRASRRTRRAARRRHRARAARR